MNKLELIEVLSQEVKEVENRLEEHFTLFEHDYLNTLLERINNLEFSEMLDHVDSHF